MPVFLIPLGKVVVLYLRTVKITTHKLKLTNCTSVIINVIQSHALPVTKLLLAKKSPEFSEIARGLLAYNDISLLSFHHNLLLLVLKANGVPCILFLVLKL